MDWVAAAVEAAVAVRVLAEVVAREAAAAPAGAEASAPAEVCGKQEKPQVAVAAELDRVVEAQEAVAKAPAAAAVLAAAGVDPEEVVEPVSAAREVLAAGLVSAVRVEPVTAAQAGELVDPAPEAALAAAGAVLEALAVAQVVEGPATAVPAVVDLVVADPAVVARAPAVAQEVQADLVDQDLAVAGRLAEAQQPNLANGSRPQPLSAAEFWVEFPAFLVCLAHPARAA